MFRYYRLLAVCFSCLVMGACNRPPTTVENSRTAQPTAGKTASSSANPAPNPIHSALDKAKSATAQTAQIAQSAIDTAQSASDQVTNTAQSASQKLKGTLALQTGLQGMMAEISTTLTAVNSGDLTTAQQEFSKVQGDWAKVGDTVKTKSATVYQQVDRQLSTVSTFLNAPNPDRAKLTAELTTLGKTLTSIPSFR